MKKLFGEKLLTLRKAKKVSQAEVAEYIGLTVAAYQNYENGRREAGYEVISKLADFYDVTTDYLLGREPAPNPFAELNLSNDDETAVMEKFMSLPDSFRACALELLRELGGAVKGNDESVQPNSQNQPGESSE